MRRYRRLLITAIVAFILLFALHLVQGRINRGFDKYLQTKYPNQSFYLSSPVIRLFPFRYELKVYDSQNKFYFFVKSKFRLYKDAVNVVQEQSNDEQRTSALEMKQVYSDDYLAQKRAKAIYEQLRPMLSNAAYKQIIARYSIQVTQPISADNEIIQPERARLLVRFKSNIKNQAEMSDNIQKLVKDLQQLNVEGLSSVYFESPVLTRNEESFLALHIPAQTWQKTRAISKGTEGSADNQSVIETQVQETEVIASGYQYAYFSYTFNYNFTFAPLNDDLIKNGLRIQELGGESLERFNRPWNYNYNA